MEIQNHCQEAIAQATLSLRQQIPQGCVRWVPTSNIHLTIQFLGQVAPDRVEMLAAKVSAAVTGHDRIKVAISGIGAFPSHARPRILWVGLKAPSSLADLHRMIINTSSQHGFQPELRPFSPHLTIGRVANNASPSELKLIEVPLKACAIGAIDRFIINAVHIFKSELLPTGARYHCLHTLPF